MFTYFSSFNNTEYLYLHFIHFVFFFKKIFQEISWTVSYLIVILFYYRKYFMFKIISDSGPFALQCFMLFPNRILANQAVDNNQHFFEQIFEKFDTTIIN